MNAYYATAGKLGVEILYDTEVRNLEIHQGNFSSATFGVNGSVKKIQAKAVVIASGGFQSNIEWFKKYWGYAAHLAPGFRGWVICHDALW